MTNHPVSALVHAAVVGVCFALAGGCTDGVAGGDAEATGDGHQDTGPAGGASSSGEGGTSPGAWVSVQDSSSGEATAAATDTDDPPGDDETGSTTGPPQGPPLQPQKYTVFNYPGAVEGGEYDDDDAVIASLIELVDHACLPACVGEVQIRMGLYRLTLPEVVVSLIEAAARGADVEVVLDGQSINDDMAEALVTGLGAGQVHRCGGATDDRACIGGQVNRGGDAINHNKFLLVSALDSGAQQVVWQSSSNATTGQLAKANNALVVRDDAALYSSYVAYFDDLRAGAMGAPVDLNYYDTTASSIAGDTGTRLYLFPRADNNVVDGPGDHVNGEDPILTVLGNLGCQEPGDRVMVAMGLWRDERAEIVDRLSTLASEGCQVEVLVRADPTRTDPEVLSALFDAGLAVYDVPHLHSKYVISDCLFKGKPRTLVWTGSHNFNYGALRENDEAMVRVDDLAVHGQYITNFETLRDNDGTPLP